MTALAFYAPMKPPDHPVPSGDREIARLLLRLLPTARLPARGRLPAASASTRPAMRRLQERIAGDASAEVARLVDRLREKPGAPGAAGSPITSTTRRPT